MTMQASEAFGLFLTALRNAGVEIPRSDRATAALVAGALAEINENFAPEDEVATAESLRLELQLMADEHLLPDDNGSN